MAAALVGVRARSFTASLTERIDDIRGNGRAAACGSVTWLAQHDGCQYLRGPTKNIWNVSEPTILANPSIVRVSREGAICIVRIAGKRTHSHPLGPTR